MHRFGASPSDLAFELLEDRLLFAAQPVVTISGDGDALVGETTQVTVSFDNVPDAAPGSDVGYTPYIDLILPTRGADGSGPGETPVETKDGVTFIGATYLGQTVDSVLLEFDASGNAIHPFARDATGALRVVHAADYGALPGDSIVSLRLPFGSFAPDQPAADVQVTLDVSELADVGVPLSLSAVGGFAFGRDSLNNPTTDAPVLGAVDNGFITPRLFLFEKTSNLPEGETATGPSFPHQYTITLDIADGQSISNLVLTDLLPDGVVYLGASAPGAAIQFQALTNNVTATFGAPVVGGPGANDVTMTIDFYVGEFLSPGQPLTPVLDPATGAWRTLENNVRGSADWTPVDTRDDPVTAVGDPAGPENVIVAKPLAIEKTATVLGGGTTAEPGDTIEWTIRVQVSDYFDLDDLTLSDLLSDGQSFDAGFTPTLSVQEQGVVTSTGAFDGANFDADRPGATTDISFLVGAEMVTRGFDSVLAGGGGAGPAPTQLVIVFRSVVDGDYASGDPVLHNDTIGNEISVEAANVASGTDLADDSDVSVVITPGQLESKTIYAINGVVLAPGAPTPLVTNGDIVTFRIQYSVPQRSVDNLVLTDFLPLPIFSALGITFQDTTSAAAPPGQVAWFGPSDTLDAANPAGYAGAPTLVIDAASNSVAFQFGDFQLAPTDGDRHIDILLSVVVQDQPFGDGLLFDNLVQSSETNSAGEASTGGATGDIILSQPHLVLQKGIVASTNSDAVFTPSIVAPVSFTAPGSGGVRFAGTLSSSILAGGEIDSDVSQVDAGDLVTYAIVVENTGTGNNGAFDIRIRDVLPAGFEIGPGGLNLSVTDGAGNALAFTGDLFGAGITLVDNGLTGALAAANANSGLNILVITYDVRLIDTVATPNQTIENDASIDHYAAEEGGTDFAPNLLPEDRFGEASATTAGPSITKGVVATSLPESSGTTLLIGEEVFYDVTLTLAEGSIADLILTDTLPNTAGGKIEFLGATLLSVGANLTFSNPGLVAGAVLTGTDSNGDGIVDRITVDFGDTLNTPDNVDNAADQIVVRIRGVVPNIPENNSGDQLTNTAVATYTDGQGDPQSIDANAAITIGAPGPTITKTVSGSTVDAGDEVTYTVVVSNPVTGGVAVPVFDLLVSDTLSDQGLTLVAGSVIVSSGTATIISGNGAGNSIVLVSQAVLGPGESLTITYRATVDADVIAGQTLTNTAVQRSDSAPGDVPEQRVFISSDGAVLNVAVPTIVKTVTATDLADTTAAQGNAALQDLAFGETATFTVTVTLPEGVTQAVVMLDQLPFAPGLLEALSASISAIGGNLTVGAVVGTPGVLSDRNGDGRMDTVTFDLGDVVNAADNVTNGNDQISFAINARLISTPSAAAGAVLVNQGELDYDTPAGTQTANAQASVEVVAPQFALTKTSDVQEVDAGDEILYTVRLTNNAGPYAAPGYDITLSDLISDANLALIAGTVTVAGVAGATVTSGNTAGDTQVGVALPRIGVGETLVITYRVVVDATAPSATDLVNRVDGTADTYPGAVDGQRTISGSAGTVVRTEGPLTAKTIVATSLTQTDRNEFTPTLTDLAIGETVTYRIIEALPEGTTTLSIRDSLPTAGVAMGLLGWRLVTVGGNITLPGAPTPILLDTDGDGRIDQVTLDFGTVINDVDNVLNADDLLTIEIDAIVVDDARNVAGDVLVNTADTFVNGLLFDTRTASAEVVEPDVVTTKTASITSGDAGDEVTFTITVAPGPSMSGPAYNLIGTDLLAPGLELIVGSVTTTGGTVILGNDPGDTMVMLTGLVLMPDAGVFTITYRARLTDAVENGQTIVNTFALNFVSAPSAEGRDYATDASSEVDVVLQPSLDKSITFTDLPQTRSSFFDPNITDVNQGETIVYRLTIRLDEGTQALTLTDAMPAGLDFLQLSAIRFGANISGNAVQNGVPVTIVGDSLALDFGTLVNRGDNIESGADDITIDIIARARVGNTAGTQLQNDATVTMTAPSDPSVASVVRTASEIVEVVAPDVEITKTADILTGDAGDEVLYTIVISRGAATGPLFRALIFEPPAAGLEYIPGSLTSSRPLIGDDPRVGLTIADFDTGDAPITITYRMRLTDAVEPGQVLVNDVAINGFSTPVPNPDTASVGDDAQAQVTVDMPVTLQKTVIDTSIAETGSSQFVTANPDVAVGERVTYRVTAALSEGTQRVIITDTIPDGLQIVEVRSTLPGMTPTITIAGQTITADFGTVVNPGNNLAEPFNLGIDVVVLVRDVPAVAEGATLVNPADVTISSPTAPGAPGGTRTASASASVDVVEPDLVLVKSSGDGFIAPGEAVTWTLVLSHAAGSTSAAFDIAIDDLLAGTELELVPGTVTVDRGSVTEGNAAGDNDVGFALDVLRLGETVTITFQTRLAPGTPPASTVTNDATGDFDSAPGLGGRTDDVAAQASLPVAPGIIKDVDSSSIPQTGTDQFDPALTDLAIGEEVVYRITVTLPQTTTNDFVLTDLLPLGLVPLSATVESIGIALSGSALAPGAAGTISGQTVSFDFGDITNGGSPAIGPEDTIVVTVRARVADVAGNDASDVLVNPATAAFTIGGRSGEQDAQASVEIVEPELTVTKTVDHATGDAGDVFTYTVTITHAAGSTAPAFDLVLEDMLPPQLQPDSVISSAGTATLSGRTVRLEVPVLLLGDAPIVLTYVVHMTDLIEPGQRVPNTAALTFSSAPTVFGRDDGAQDSTIVTGVFGLDLEKEIVSTSMPQTGSEQFDPARPDLAIGELVTYRFTATLSEGTQRFIVTDTLPEGVVPITARLVSAGGVSFGPPTVTVNGQVVTFDFGVVVNTGNNLPDDSLVFEVDARVADAAVNTSGRIAVNTASALIASPSAPLAPGGTVIASDTADADIVTPVIAVDKTADAQFATIGQTVNYTVVVSHAPGSTAPIFDLVITDALIPGVTRLVAGSVTTSAGVVVTGNAAGDTTIRVELPQLLLGETVTIQYAVEVIGIPVPAGEAVNTAVASGDSTPEPLPPEFVRVTQGSDTASFLVSSGGGFPSGSELDRDLFWDYPIRTQPPLIITPIYSGTGFPGSALFLTAYDELGAPMGFTTTLVDMGGNWLARFPWPYPSKLPVGTVADRLADTALFADRDNGLGATLPRASAPHGSGSAVVQPYALSIVYSDPTPFVSPHLITPPQVTFDGAYRVQTQVETHEGSLAWNAYARDFANRLMEQGWRTLRP